jgi:hypothetical protein
MNTEIRAQSSDKIDTDEDVVFIIRPTHYTETKSPGIEFEVSTALAPLDIILIQFHPPHNLTYQNPKIHLYVILQSPS